MLYFNMSCEMRQIAQLPGIDTWQKRFLAMGISFSKPESWLQECVVSFTQTGEVLVIAKDAYVALFTSVYNAKDAKTNYIVTWEGEPCCKSGNITSVLCLPFLPQQQSATGADWTCIVIGYSSGTIKFFTESMHELLSEVLHSEPIIHIKWNIHNAASQWGYMNLPEHESIYVLYKSVICVINGFSLFQTLRGCRNRLVRCSASSRERSTDVNFPMDFKKYGFTDQDGITDACFIGQTTVNIYDYLVSESLAVGFDSNYWLSPPQTSLIIATGRKPFLGFHYTVEGGGNPVLADVAVAVASKIKESVAATFPAWFGFGSSEQEKLKVSQEPAEQLRCKFGLDDFTRHGSVIVLSPDRKFSAVTDNLARIFLIDNLVGITRRLWKGYQNAQCGFIEVEEDIEKSRHKKTKIGSREGSAVPKRALFLVIYVPRRGLIEVFCVQQGPCVASFRVSNHGLLLYTPCGLFGFNNLSSKEINTSRSSVAFLSSNGVEEVIVPFHYALRSGSSNKARDLHIMKKIKVYFREDHRNDPKFDDDMKFFAKQLKTDEIKVQFVEMLMSNKHITANAFMAALNVFIEGFKVEDDESLSKNFVMLVESLEKLLAFFIFLQDLNSQPPNYKTVIDSEGSDSFLAETLLLSSKEITLVSKLMDTVKEMENKKPDVKVAFLDNKDRNVTHFLSCFDFNCFANDFSKVDVKNEFYLNMKTDLSSDKMTWIGECLFSGIFYSDEWINDWKTYVSECKLNPNHLINCLISYWSNKSITDNLTYEVTSLVELLKTICSLVDPEVISIEYNKRSPWWIAVTNHLKKMPCSITGLLAALACRAVTISVEQMKEMRQIHSEKKQIEENDTNNDCQESQGDASSSLNSEWENVSKDTWQWDILIVNLEDLTLLNSVVNLTFKVETPRPKLDFHCGELSINYIISKGDGFISELVAKWLAQFGLDPECLIAPKDVEFQVTKCKRDSLTPEGDPDSIKEAADVELATAVKECENVPIILDYLNVLKEKFPYSLTSSSLLGNISWEYMIYWCKNPNELTCLETSVEYLSKIPSVDLKNGLSYLCWTTYVVQKFSAVAKLINTCGVRPKDKFSMQEVSLTSIQVPAFLKLCTELLSIMLETSVSDKKEFITSQESLWQNEIIGSTSSLVTIALSQPKINKDVLVLHYQLCLCLLMISELNIKFPKLFSSVFDNVSQSLFFTDLAKQSQLLNDSEAKFLSASRIKLLYKVIAGAVQTIEIIESIPPFPVEESIKYVPEARPNVEKATKWIGHCFELACLWDIPHDELRRQYVCELYSCGFDRLAEEIIPAVEIQHVLASQLLVIAGQRLKVYIYGSLKPLKKLSVLSPNLLHWLESLDSENLKNHNIDLKDLQTMLSYIRLGHLTAMESRLEQEIIDCIPSLEANQTSN